MARKYDPAPRKFLFGDGAELEREILANDPQEAYEAFQSFSTELAGAEVQLLSIEDPAAEEGLALLVGPGAVARVTGADTPRTEYCSVPHPRRFDAFVMRFFEDGFDGPAALGQWFPDLDALTASPEERGERRAAVMTAESEALEEVVRIWHDSGIVDPSDQHYVFFHTHALEDSRDERAALLKLVETLGLERVDAPEGASDGEVWILKDARIEEELELWS